MERLPAAITSSDVAARVAAYLLELPGRMRDGAPTVRLPMAKQDIAAYLGSTPETPSRRLAALVASAGIEPHGRREVTILDVAALEREATPR